jgi:hypothetical protein
VFAGCVRSHFAFVRHARLGATPATDVDRWCNVDYDYYVIYKIGKLRRVLSNFSVFPRFFGAGFPHAGLTLVPTIRFPCLPRSFPFSIPKWPNVPNLVPKSLAVPQLLGRIRHGSFFTLYAVHLRKVMCVCEQAYSSCCFLDKTPVLFCVEMSQKRSRLVLSS